MTATTLTADDRTSVQTSRSVFRVGFGLPEVRWAAAALVLFLLGWGLQLADAPSWSWWPVYLACYLTGGWGPALAGLRALRERTLDVDLLMIVAAIAAASIGQVFDGALLIVIFATSGALETVVTQRTADSVRSLLGVTPERATLVDPDGSSREIDCEELQVGQCILIRPGERVGADGVVVGGVSEVDQQAVTGESVPVPRRVGDPVLSGTVNGTGALTVEVTRPASESVIARIVSLVDDASQTKAPTQLFIDKIEQTYSFTIVVATVLVLVVPLTVFDASFEDALLRAIVFMIVASPCAVVLSTMPPLLASIANAGRHGVLVKSAAVMEAVGRTDLIAFDKTGTLTEGRPEVATVTALRDDRTPDDVLALAAAVERPSEHPVGRAIVRAAVERGLRPGPVEHFRALPGRGVSGVVRDRPGRDRTVVVERAELDDAVGTAVGVVVENAPNVSVVEPVDRVATDCVDVGRIELVDRVRDGAAGAVARAQQVTSQPAIMLTGDNARTAEHVGEQCGVSVIHAGLLPEDKARIVDDHERAGRRVLLVGDGINDAPALMSASTGIAMGRHGSDLAIDTADAIIVRDDLDAVPALIRLSRSARHYVVANLCLAATVIVTLVIWDLVGTLPLPLAVAGHEGSTILVALNGARLLRRSAWSPG